VGRGTSDERTCAPGFVIKVSEKGKLDEEFKALDVVCGRDHSHGSIGSITL
jgi:hypothetical protein